MRKRNKLIKQIICGALTLAMVLPQTLAVPADAHMVYDPTEGVNHGVKIDTTLIPNDDNISVKSSEDGKEITTRTNVQFQLDCSVDSTWKIEGADDAAKAQVSSGEVSIDERNGLVKVQPDAITANYIITATAYNVEVSKSATINLKVDAAKDPAKAKNIRLVSEEMENDYVDISEDEKTITVDGRQSVDMVVAYEPEYLLDNEISFSPEEKTDIFSIDNNILRLNTLGKTEKTEIKCKVGTSEKVQNTENFNLIINKLDYKQNIATDDIKYSNETNRTYSMQMNQDVDFYLSQNSEMVLPAKNISDVKWSVKVGKEDSSELTAQNPISLKGSATKKELVTIEKIGNGIDAYVKVKTAFDTSSSDEIDAIELSCTATMDDNATENAKTININFNTAAKASFGQVTLDFQRAGLEEDIDYSIEKENIEGKDTDVYYFESDGSNLNLVNATFADVSGVRTFEESKDDYAFSGDENRAKITYAIDDLKFGSDSLNKKYNNQKLVAREGDFNALGELKYGTDFQKIGIGYKKLTVKLDGSKSSEYVIRFVTPSTNLRRCGLAIGYTDDSNEFYDADMDTIHIRQAEAIIPGVFTKNYAKDETDISIYNPFLEYEMDKEDIVSVTASTTGDNKAGIYRINGLNPGKVIVTVRGKVNKSNYRDITLYVNEDIYDIDFDIDTSEAQNGGMIDNNYVISGRYDKIPLGLTSTSQMGGIPKVKWSVSCSSDVATIDKDTGILTTKKSTGNDEKIKVTATSVVDEKKTASKEFTVKEVTGTGILTIEEAGDLGLVTATGVNEGKCDAGAEFTLKPVRYNPENATKLDGTITWSSDKPEVATVDAKTGVVNAYTEGVARISATYQPGDGNAAVTTIYTLKVDGSLIRVSDISLDKDELVLNRIAQTANISAKVLPENATEKGLIYESSDSTIATVGDAGQVTAIGVGECNITIISKDNAEIKKVVKVTVKGEADPTVNPSVEPKETDSPATSEAPTASGTPAASGAPDVTNAPAITVAPTVTQAPAASGSDTATNTKNPGKTKVKSVKQVKTTKKAKVTLKAAKNVNGYQVRYSLKKTMSGAKKVNVKKNAATLRGLKKGKTYYVQARTYATVNGAKVFTAWSAKKKLKMKR